MASNYIPKIIHQSFSTQTLPLQIVRNIKKIQQLNPNWQYRFYDDEHIVWFIKKYYNQDVLKAYEKINFCYGAARADFFRYLLLYECGGVWLDIKSSMEYALDEVLKKDDYFILSQWQNKMGEPYQGWGLFEELKHVPGGEFQQWHIITGAKNPALKNVIDQVIHNIYNYRFDTIGAGHKAVVLTTGPIAYTLSILPYLNKIYPRFADIEKDLGFTYSIYKDLEYRLMYKTHYSNLNEALILN